MKPEIKAGIKTGILRILLCHLIVFSMYGIASFIHDFKNQFTNPWIWVVSLVIYFVTGFKDGRSDFLKNYKEVVK